CREARAALPGFAIPAAGEIRCLCALNIMNCIQHDHAFSNFRRVIAKFAAVNVAPPDFERGRFHSLKCRSDEGLKRPKNKSSRSPSLRSSSEEASRTLEESPAARPRKKR